MKGGRLINGTNLLPFRRMVLLESLSLIHIFMESLPQAVLQAGAIVVKSVVNNDKQCFYHKSLLENWIGEKNSENKVVGYKKMYLIACT